MSALNEEALRELVAVHADLLNAGEEEADRFVQQQPALDSEAMAYLYLALRLKRMLVPVPVPPPFRRRLRQELLTADDADGSIARHIRRHPVWVGAAAAGSLVPLVGLFLFWRRRQRTHALSNAS